MEVSTDVRGWSHLNKWNSSYMYISPSAKNTNNQADGFLTDVITVSGAV